MTAIQLPNNLTLEPITPDHSAALYQLISEQRVRLAEWLAWPNFIQSAEDYRGFIDRCLTERAQGESAVYCILWQGKPIGTAGYVALLPELKKGEIGYWLSADCEGYGLATQVVTALISLGAESGLSKIEASVATTNSRSMAVCERAGLHIEATIAQDEFLNGKILDHHKYARFIN